MIVVFDDLIIDERFKLEADQIRRKELLENQAAIMYNLIRSDRN